MSHLATEGDDHKNLPCYEFINNIDIYVHTFASLVRLI